MLRNYSASLHKRVPAGAFPHKFNVCSFHYTTDCAAALFYLLNCKRLLQVVWIPLHMQPKVLSIGTFKKFKQSFKFFKPQVLKATSFRSWNETIFQIFCDTYCLSKILFKNVCINSFRTLCFLSFVPDVIGTL